MNIIWSHMCTNGIRSDECEAHSISFIFIMHYVSSLIYPGSTFKGIVHHLDLLILLLARKQIRSFPKRLNYFSNLSPICMLKLTNFNMSNKKDFKKCD